MKKKTTKTYLFTYNMAFVNILSLFIILICLLILFFLYRLGWLNNVIDSYLKLEESNSFLSSFTSLLFLLIYMCFHEGIHGLFYYLNGASWANIKFGIALEKGILFTKCGEYVNKKNILISVISPFLILGLLTLILSIVFGLPYLFALSVFNIAGCSGDLMMFTFFLFRDSDIKFKELGDSSTFLLQTKEDLTTKNFISVKLCEEVKEEPIDQSFTKKWNLSNFSFWLLFILFAIGLFSSLITSCLILPDLL